MVQVAGGVSGQHQTAAEGHKMLMGNACLLANTLAMAIYFITAKQLVLKYPPMCVAAWAYITAAVCMGAAAAAFVEQKDWQLPSIMLGPLAYWVVVCSVIGYYVVTWATQYLPASQARILLQHLALSVLFDYCCWPSVLPAAFAAQLFLQTHLFAHGYYCQSGSVNICRRSCCCNFPSMQLDADHSWLQEQLPGPASKNAPMIAMLSRRS